MKNSQCTREEKSLLEVASALSKMESPEEIRRFLGEICTESECRDIALRWHLMKMLADGVPQRTISKELGLSLCKITRGSKYMKDATSIFRRFIVQAMKKGCDSTS